MGDRNAVVLEPNFVAAQRVMDSGLADTVYNYKIIIVCLSIMVLLLIFCLIYLQFSKPEEHKGAGTTYKPPEASRPMNAPVQQPTAPVSANSGAAPAPTPTPRPQMRPPIPQPRADADELKRFAQQAPSARPPPAPAPKVEDSESEEDEPDLEQKKQ